MRAVAARSLRCAQRVAPPSRRTTARLERELSTAREIERPQLPVAQTLQINGNYALKYIDMRHADTAASDDASIKPTIAFIHGAPGSFQDFKHIIPLLQHKARIVAINLPGNGDSHVLNGENYYDHIQAIHVGRSAFDALVHLCSDDEHVFVLGHSFGGHATINIAAFNQVERKLNLRGMALLASAGLRPHKALQPRTNAIAWAMLRSKFPLLEKSAQELIKFLYVHLLKFPNNAPTEHFVAGLVRCATTKFSLIHQHVACVRDVPAFFAWARDDAFMEEQIFVELSEQCHPGPRFAFERGGHNIQKTKAPFLAEQLLQWMQAVIRGDVTKHTRDITLHH